MFFYYKLYPFACENIANKRLCAFIFLILSHLWFFFSQHQFPLKRVMMYRVHTHSIISCGFCNTYIIRISRKIMLHIKCARTLIDIPIKAIVLKDKEERKLSLHFC